MSPPSSLGSVEAGRPPRNASIPAGTPNLVQNEISHSFSHILHRSASYKRKLLDWTWSLWERTADGDRITTYIQDVLLILNIRPKQITVLKQKLFDLYPNKPKVWPRNIRDSAIKKKPISDCVKMAQRITREQEAVKRDRASAQGIAWYLSSPTRTSYPQSKKQYESTLSHSLRPVLKSSSQV